jgi:hypothetical protein
LPAYGHTPGPIIPALPGHYAKTRLKLPIRSYDVAADRRTEAAFRSAVPRIRSEEIAEWSVELLGKLWGSQAMPLGVGPSDDDAPERFDFIP